MSFLNIKQTARFSSTDQAIYRFITAHSDQIPYMRVRDIAKEAHVSNSSVMRFVHKAGFSSFPYFKALLKSKIDVDQPVASGFDFIDASNFPKDILKKIGFVVNRISDSDNIIFLGMGSSGTTAEYAARKSAALGYNSVVITDPFYPLFTKMKNTSNNVVIVYSVSGKTQELIDMLSNFEDNEDFLLVSITSNAGSPIAMMSDDVLDYTVKKQHLKIYYDLTTQIPAMYITDAIFSKLIERT